MIAFAVSIAVFHERIAVQALLGSLGAILLIYLWRLPEKPVGSVQELN